MLAPLGYTTPAEFEDMYHCTRRDPAKVAGLRKQAPGISRASPSPRTRIPEGRTAVNRLGSAFGSGASSTSGTLACTHGRARIGRPQRVTETGLIDLQSSAKGVTVPPAARQPPANSTTSARSSLRRCVSHLSLGGHLRGVTSDLRLPIVLPEVCPGRWHRQDGARRGHTLAQPALVDTRTRQRRGGIRGR